MRSNIHHISRIRNTFKLTEEDITITDRYIYSLMIKYRDFVVKRATLNKVLNQNNLFQSKNYSELIEVDTVEACGIETDCKIKRTKYKIDPIFEGESGLLIRWVGSLDGSQEIKKTSAPTYSRKLKKKTSKYNTDTYYWYSNGYLYFPNLEWDAIKINAYFEGDVINDCNDEDPVCIVKRDETFRIPDYLVADMDQLIFQDLTSYVKLQRDEDNNNNENTK